MLHIVDRIIDHYLYPSVKNNSALVYPTYNVGGTECLVVTRDDATCWMLYCHGNAVTLQDLYSSGVASNIAEKCKCNFVAPAYPENASIGRTHDSAIVSAVRAAYDRICDDHGDQVYVAGRSLGVGVALAACCNRPPCGLLLLSGFSSLYNMVPMFVPRCMVGRRYENDKLIGETQLEKVPKLIVHGTNDTVVPVHHASELAACAANTRLCIVSGMDHSPDRHWTEVFNLFADFLSHKSTEEFGQNNYPLWKC